MSISQRAVMLCGWGVKAGWCNLQVKLCDPCLSALDVGTTMRYTNRRILYFTLLKRFQHPTLPNKRYRSHSEETTCSPADGHSVLSGE